MHVPARRTTAATTTGGGLPPECSVTPYRVDYEASGLASHEGRTAILVTHSGQGTCAASTERTVTAGGFSASLTTVSNFSVYPVLLAYFDLDGDGNCTNGDLAYMRVESLGCDPCAFTVSLDADSFAPVTTPADCGT